MNNETFNKVLKGDRYRTTLDVNMHGLTTWAAPYTGSFECVVPAGTIFVVDQDPVPSAAGFGCVPEQYEEFEKRLVPAHDRDEPKYGGYYFVFRNEDIGSKLSLVSRGR